MKPKNILFVVSECSGFVATGGLAEVAGSLPIAIMRSNKDYKVSVVMPLYKIVEKKYKDELKFLGKTNINLSWREVYAGFYTLTQAGVDYYFVDNKHYFERDEIYGYDDDGERFAFFSKSIFDLLPLLKFRPNIIHTNDWHTAAVNIYLDILYKKQGVNLDIKSVFTIHNIQFQGIYDSHFLGDVLGIDYQHHGILEYHGLINLVKGAIICSDLFTTVSPRYAEEIKTSEYSWGLEHVIRINANKLRGVINGINLDFYNPKTDEGLTRNFDVNSLSLKAHNKETLQRGLNLEIRNDVPLIAVITRLTGQKGVDLIIDVFDELMKEDVQVVILGKGDNFYERKLEAFALKYPKRVSSLITFDVELSKKIYGSSDYFLMPSKTEPCGLAQMIASRYGTVPIVRATGGLFDTIKDYQGGKGNGFAFEEYNSRVMLKKIKEAITLYKNKEEYLALSKKAMEVDFSWDNSARSYISLYEDLLKK